MTDYGRITEFGFFLVPSAADYPALVEQARLADRSGLELIGIQDHPYQRRFLDTFSLIAGLAAATDRVRFFPDVANLPLRPPAVMAKAAASIDVMSGGRFELGLGAGAFWDAIEGMGGPRWKPAAAVEAVAEAIEVMRLMWSGGRGLRFEGRHYRLKGIHSGPPAAHDIAVWVGAGGPRMLDLIGSIADGWVPPARTEQSRLTEMQDRIDTAATGAGRAPAAVRRIYNVAGTITDGRRGDRFEGPVRAWIDELTRLVVDVGMDTFIMWPAGDAAEQLKRFAEEVVPGVRGEVAAHRGDTGPHK
jgi:alkanesulfonate monooxygenase SsuD/methylene tetrahydromethanopterin reductase-like flavin-dependent oxidoreductase (luciferase family)